MTNSIELANKRGVAKLANEVSSLDVRSEVSRKRAATIGLVLRMFVKFRAEKHDDKIRDLNELKKKWIAKRKDEVGAAEELIEIVDDKLRKEYIARVQENDLRQEQTRQMEAVTESSTLPDFIPQFISARVNGTIETEIGSVNIRPDSQIVVKDKMALIKAIAACEWPSTWIEIDTAFIKKDIKEKGWNKIPGIEILPWGVVTGRTK
jgi:hypothetical protein